ncbi:aromatase/cyclase [Microbispora sp. NBRC 16548]|uniref:aromatase/cyclase n=1 Tax=Microbispora sp. NBRC 16548 TaxID=3030994 RepID=UPI0024A15429|nr:aromatase/cyclase [Microbispora sp. NBRC 16548]GLX05379.1 actinorhodin polyketide synthase bifunctional cyclase/dehydratase [Microbispora sp. NBRC 16548]
MSQLATHHDEHAITVPAPAEVVYEVIADVTRWPFTFTPTVHAERLEQTGDEELIRLWALANDEVKTWTSRRVLDRAGRRVRFRQEVSQPPVAAMGGEWVLEPVSEDETRVLLKHDFQALDDDPAGVDWIKKAVDRNSLSELDRLKHAAEAAGELAELTVSFDDSIRIDGGIDDVYEFLYEAREWPRRLPHVARLDLAEDTPGIQVMEMDTTAANGSVHTTKSVRVCFPNSRIVYKQTEVPALMSAHVGEWSLRAVGGAVTATSRHTVMIRRDAVTAVLGEGATVRKARDFVRQALGKNSMTTLEHAKAFAESRGRG